MKRVLVLLVLSLGFCFLSSAQENISVSTGLSVLRNFSPKQGFWAIGHTLQTTVHFSAKQSAYAWIEYYTEGKFKNSFAAIAQSPLTQPQRRALTATGRLRYQHFSLGWKHYFRGTYANEKSLSVYGLAGFGFLFSRVRNVFSTDVDTALYRVQTSAGEGNVRKLTFDVGVGAEWPVNANFYLFGDARTWLPASSNENPYLHNQRNVPLPAMLTAGVRVLLGSVQ